MNGRYPIRMQYLDSGNSTEFRNPAPVSAPGPPKANAFSPAVVAVIGVLAGAFLIISYYRIFLKYCNSHHLSIWGTRSDTRNGGPSTIVLMEEPAWPPDALGLDGALISRIPTCKYKTGEGIVDGTECSVCLGEFEEGEELRILPKCNHPFHIPCIDTWLAASSTCPLCRVNIVLAAAVPYALLPVEREPPVGPTMSLVPLASTPNPMQALINHEIEILQEQHVQEFLEAGQLSGPPSRRSSHGSSFHNGGLEFFSIRSLNPNMWNLSDVACTAPEMGTPDTHRIDMPVLQPMMRQMSLELPTRETHLRPPTVQRSVTIHSHRQVANKLYSRARSANRKHPLSSPQRKRFARLLTGSSRSLTGSSSMNQVVVELLAQEIFQTSTDPGKVPVASSASTGTKKIRHDNASFELMWSIHEQENPLMWSVNEDPAAGSARTLCRTLSVMSSSSEDEMEDLAERLADSMQLRSNPGSDYEDDQEEDVPVTKRMVRSNSSGSAWPSKRHSLKHSMSRLKRYGSVSSLRRFEKVHASDPVFEMFEVD